MHLRWQASELEEEIRSRALAKPVDGLALACRVAARGAAERRYRACQDDVHSALDRNAPPSRADAC